MKANLKVQLSQQLAMTPQLLQSIRLLQLDALQLELEVRRMLERNPLLEQDEDQDDPAPVAAPRAVIEEDDADCAWERGLHPAGGGEDDDALARIPDHGSSDFRSHLLEQFALESRSRGDVALAALVLDHVDDNGYLEASVDALRAAAAAQGLDADGVEAVRQRLMRCEPAGCGARDLAECLGAQLDTRAGADPLAREIVRRHLPLLAAHDFAGLARALGVDRARAEAAVDVVLALDPRPASGWGASAEDAVVVPDVVVRRADGTWRVALNPRTAPRVRVNAALERLLGDAQGPGEQAVMRELLQEARWMARGVAIRNDTLLRATTAIVERQHAFLERGEEAMVPLTLKEIADAIGVHESTVSRISTGKYVQTPRGTFELKRFFAVRLHGAEVGGTAVRAMVRKLIEQESPLAPLGDDAIAVLLARQGVRVARRTIAKYRDQLSIPPAKVRALAHANRSARIARSA